MRRVAFVLFAALLLAGCGGGRKADEPLPSAARKLTLASSALRPGAMIPRRYTCDGEGISPPLSWSGVPAKAKELALIVDDPDAGHFVHWTVLRIPVTQTRLGEGRAPRGSLETENSFGKKGWGAPCPPKGNKPHRYVFALYAADAPLGLDARSSPDEVRRRLAKHALASGRLVARYRRS